jgi:hypothetical protein
LSASLPSPGCIRQRRGEDGEAFASSYASTGGAVGSQTTSASVVSSGAQGPSA